VVHLGSPLDQRQRTAAFFARSIWSSVQSGEVAVDVQPGDKLYLKPEDRVKLW
jgi:predicted metalloendopeptidase